MTDGPTDDGLEEPSSMEEVDCPGCESGAEPERFPETIVEAGGDWWHSICLLEAHPQIEQREAKTCPNCGTASEYRPLTRGPRARSCPCCLQKFPGWAEVRDDVTLETPPFDGDSASDGDTDGGTGTDNE